jgi:hypothetical protein
MRRSLFDNYAPQEYKQPRLQPNFFAKLAQFSFRHAYVVLAFWFAISVGLAVFAFQQKPLAPIPFEFAANSSAQKYQSLLEKEFPNLNTMITINISNADAERLKRARQLLISGLEADTENFDVAYAPGTGTYYETHAILYHTLDDIKARVAYAKSLKPLFDAIAEAPTTASLATLVNEVLGSIEQGRDPQGLDELFSESAKAVQALMLGNERPVDWNFVAGLNAENAATNALVFAVPQKGKAVAAATALKTLIATLPQDDGTTTLVDQPEPSSAEIEPPATLKQLPAALAMAAILVAFAFAAFIGDLTLSAMIVVPTSIAVAIYSSAALIALPTLNTNFWPMQIAVGFLTLLGAARLAFALVETHNIARTRESAVMLASQKQGGTILWMSIAASTIMAALLASQSLNYLVPVLLAVAVFIFSALLVISASSAIASFHPEPSYWHASQWLHPVSNAILKNNFTQLLLKSTAVAAVLCGALGFWFAPTLTAETTAPKIHEAAVNIVATSLEEADLILAKLKTIPEAQGVRWIGAFLPQQVEEKQKILSELKDQFPRITPLIPQDVDLLREHISTLQESLKAIGNAPAARPALKSAASEFRQSLELLAATSENKEVLAFENRIFGSFNVLPERSQAFVDMDKPNFDSFDPRLRNLFLSPSGTLRLEVTPLANVSNEDLARKLSAERFHVAHPVLVADGAQSARLQTFEYALGAALLLAVLAVLIFTRSAIETLSFTFAVVSLLGIQMGCLVLTHAALDLRNLLISIAAICFITLFAIDHHAQPKRHEKSIESLLPIIVAACACLPFALLKQIHLLNNFGQVALFACLALLIISAFETLTKPRFALPHHSVQ